MVSGLCASGSVEWGTGVADCRVTSENGIGVSDCSMILLDDRAEVAVFRNDGARLERAFGWVIGSDLVGGNSLTPEF